MKKKILSILLVATLNLTHKAMANTIEVYAQNETLSPVVSYFNERQFEQALTLIDEITAKNPKNLDAHRMGMMVGTSKDDFTAILYHADEILSQNPKDPQALYIKGIYSKGAGLQGYDDALQKMIIHHPKVAKVMDNIASDVDTLWEKPVHKSTPNISAQGLGILALGSPANPDGTPQPRLLKTLTKTLELAQNFPDAPIFVTGGAVYTSMTESQAMKNWLVSKGVLADRIIMEDQARDTVGNALNIMPYLKEKNLNNLLLVTVEYHLRRASLIIDGVLEKQGMNVDVIGVAGESDKIGHDYAKRMIIERAASYRDRGRVYGLFEHADFLAFSK